MLVSHKSIAAFQRARELLSTGKHRSIAAIFANFRGFAFPSTYSLGKCSPIRVYLETTIISRAVLMLHVKGRKPTEDVKRSAACDAFWCLPTWNDIHRSKHCLHNTRCVSIRENALIRHLPKADDLSLTASQKCNGPKTRIWVVCRRSFEQIAIAAMCLKCRCVEFNRRLSCYQPDLFKNAWCTVTASLRAPLHSPLKQTQQQIRHVGNLSKYTRWIWIDLNSLRDDKR